MRYEGIHVCIFSYDGIDRIRFTGLDLAFHSQPGITDSPKTNLFCGWLHYTTAAAYVKKNREISCILTHTMLYFNVGKDEFVRSEQYDSSGKYT